MTENPLNWNSRSLTHGWQRGVNAFFWGLGFKPEDFDKAQIGIGTPLLDGNICNVHAHELAQLIKQGCADAGLIGFPFGVSPVSDNITQGNIGGAASLCSRNLMANGAEMVCTSHCYDAIIGLHHCDKNGPPLPWLWRAPTIPDSSSMAAASCLAATKDTPRAFSTSMTPPRRKSRAR
jgi:dihydroxy-acid dehydratase